MTIKRKGVKYQLSDTELYQAAKEYERECRAEDVKSRFEDLCERKFPGTDAEAKVIGDRVEDILSHVDGYWDIYWEVVGDAIGEWIKNK